MIAQIVFDLPLDGPFDYSIPEHLVPAVAVGTRVKVSFGPRPQVGFVIGLLEASAFSKLKTVQSLCDASPAFDSLDLIFARDFSGYYGCSLGEALSTILRNKKDPRPSIRRDHKPELSLYRCPPDSYAAKIQEIMDGYRRHSKNHFLILVPDAFRSEMLVSKLKGLGPVRIGTRSSVFECDGQHDCVIMVDEEDPSYKQESMPMYETRQVLLTRSKIYGFDVAFVGISPSVELMAQVLEGKIKFVEEPAAGAPAVRMIDLSNYKFVPGLISPPVRDALEAALKAGGKSILVLNRKGSYRLTRCVDCAEILKCTRCDSPLIYSRSEGKFLCRHCAYTAPGDTVCPKCHKPSWRSIGIGVEQVQAELKKYFPQAKIHAFERGAKSTVGPKPMGDFDILISTQAVLRFQGTLKVRLAAFIDFDAELNRLDMRCAFNAFSLALHISSMALNEVFIQTRNSGHYVLQSLSRGNIKYFYDEELKLRKELGFSPFKHWVRISWRGKSEKSTQEQALQVYNGLSRSSSGERCFITPPLADAVSRKRGQFRFNVMVQADQAAPAVAFIKNTLAQIKRRSRVIVTMNVDP
jgi:primosomal protein N' (replication factor Y) (superfamily II helicase)